MPDAKKNSILFNVGGIVKEQIHFCLVVAFNLSIGLLVVCYCDEILCGKVCAKREEESTW